MSSGVLTVAQVFSPDPNKPPFYADLPFAMVDGKLQVDESYLEESGRVLRTRSAWRSFVTEQRVLVSQLPALESRLGEISAPTAIVVGTEDRVVAPRAARQLATQISGARLSLVEGAGHLLPLLAPGPLAELILDPTGHRGAQSVA